MISELFETLQITIAPDGGGHRLDRYLGSKEKIGSRTRAVQLIESGHITVNGKTPKSSLFLKQGDVIIVKIPTTPTPSKLEPLNLKLDIVYEDDDVIVVNKPAGLVVHPAAGHAQDTLVNALLNYTTNLAMGFNEARPGIVHRIDRDTSGLLVVAKNDNAHHALAAQFKQKSTHRIYWAITYGLYPANLGTFESKLARHPHDRKRFASTQKEGKIAITHYKQIKTFNKEFSLLELKLDTGRTHQIRVHVSESGHPIVGDTLYGGGPKTKNIKNGNAKDIIMNMKRFALHACELGFTHPKTQEVLLFKSPWPEDLQPLVSALGFS